MPERLEQLNSWLHERMEHKEFTIKPASEDASFRRYYRVKSQDTSYIVMDAPPEHEDCKRFIDIARRLRACGVNAPEIFDMDLKSGFILLTDFGDILYLDVLDDANVDTLYNDALATLHNFQVKADQSNIPLYDEPLLLGEMELFRSWLLKRHLGFDLESSQDHELNVTFTMLKDMALEQPQTFVHRDYHSRNLMYVAANNPGVLDFQDAVTGPVTYDLVSLLKDCYIKWPQKQIEQWSMQYFRKLDVDTINKNDFQRWFDLMGVQRHLKASGIFARLFHRDGKSGFLKDIPRTLSYIIDLKENYPELGFLIELIQKQVLPGLEEASR